MYEGPSEHTDEWYFENWCGADSKTLTAACFSRISAGRSAPKTILNHFVLFRHDILKFWRCPQCFKTVTSFNHWDVPHGKRYMSSTSSTTRFGNVVLEDQQVNCYWGSTLNQTSHREASVHTAENNRAAWAFPRWGTKMCNNYSRNPNFNDAWNLTQVLLKFWMFLSKKRVSSWVYKHGKTHIQDHEKNWKTYPNGVVASHPQIHKVVKLDLWRPRQSCDGMGRPAHRSVMAWAGYLHNSLQCFFWVDKCWYVFFIISLVFVGTTQDLGIMCALAGMQNTRTFLAWSTENGPSGHPVMFMWYLHHCDPTLKCQLLKMPYPYDTTSSTPPFDGGWPDIKTLTQNPFYSVYSLTSWKPSSSSVAGLPISKKV